MATVQTQRTHGYSASKQQLLNRLSRMEGQVRGLERMAEEDRYRIDVLTQIAAVQAALQKIALGCSTVTCACACSAAVAARRRIPMRARAS